MHFDENKKESIKILIYKIIFSFNIYFQKEKIRENLKNKNINDIIYKLISDEFAYFKKNDLLLNAEELSELIKYANNFEKIGNFFDFNHNFDDLLKAINNNCDFVIKKFGESIYQKPLKLDIYIIPKEQDDIKNITSEYLSLVNNMKHKGNIKNIISISPNLIEKYIEINNGINYDNLYNLKKLIEEIQKINKAFKITKYDINKICNDSGLKLINNGKFSNEQILDFIMNNKYFSNKNRDEQNSDILENLIKHIKLKDINAKDVEKWRKIEWTKLYKDISDLFTIILDLVKNLEDFEKIFDLLIKEPHFKIYQNELARLIAGLFLSKYKTEPKKNLIKNIYTIKKIVVYYMTFNDKTEFFEKIINTFDKYFTSNLFLIILDNEKNIKEVMKKFMINFLEKEIKTGIPEVLFDLIKIIGNKNSIIANKFKKYVINENSFFSLEENKEIKLLKLLINGRVLPNKNSNNSFLKNSYDEIENLKNKIINYNFSYNDINKFFKDENILIFEERFGLLYLINIKDSKEIGRNYDDSFDEKKEYINNIKQIIKDRILLKKENINALELIINDFNTFYPISQKSQINECTELLNRCKTHPIFEEEDIIEKIKVKYHTKAQERSNIKNSILFQSLYNKYKVILKNDEAKILNDSIIEFNELKKVLNTNLNEVPDHLIKMCLEEFKYKSNEEIKEEITKLVKIFNINNFEIELLTNNYELLSNKENIINVVKSAQVFIEKIGSIKTTYFTNLNLFISSCENNYDIESINMILDCLKNTGLDVKNKFCAVLAALGKNPESIEFILNKSLSECSILHGVVNNGDEDIFLTSADIIQLENCVKFMENLKKIGELKKITDYDLIIKAENLFTEFQNKDKNYDVNFINYSENFQRIKELFNQKFNQSEALKQKIENIFKNSSFILSNEKEPFFWENYEIPNKENNNKEIKNEKYKKKMTMDELEELNIKIQIANKFQNEQEEKSKNYFPDFINLMNDFRSIISILKDIYVRGYPKIIQIEIKINNSKKHYEMNICDNEKENQKNNDEIRTNIINEKEQIKDVKYILSKLKTIRENLKKSQHEGYKKYEYIRYMFGRQFNKLYNYLKQLEQGKKEQNNEFITHFLNYITNNKLEKTISEYTWIRKEEDEFQNIVFNINEFIQKNLLINNLSSKDVYSDSKLISGEYKGFYLYSCVDNLEKQLYQLYNYLTGKRPVAQNILFCNVDTTKEEIESFLYRAILCQYNSCFMIGGIESLEFGPKNYLIEFLNEIISEYGENMVSCLIVLSSDKTTDIHKSLDLIKCKKIFEEEISNKTKKCFLNNTDNIEIVKSDKAGVGKSEFIKELKLNYLNRLYFPLGGSFSRDDLKNKGSEIDDPVDIFNRLRKMNINNESLIHLDLYDSDDIDLITYFLFEFLILKSYKRNEEILMLPNNIYIVIEIPNGFTDYESKFPILDLIPNNLRTSLSIKELKPLIVYPKIKSNIQIVCNYLKLRRDNKLDTDDLIIPGVNDDCFIEKKDEEKKVEEKKDDKISKKPKDKKRKKAKKKEEKENQKKPEKKLPSAFIKAERLSQQECQELIFDLFKEDEDKFPSYYQIKSFIDVFAEQLKTFSKNYILSIDSLREFRSIDLTKIRTYIIEGFINVTKYFTRAAYNKLIYEQNIAYSKRFGIYDENKDIQKAIKNLEKFKHNIISYDEIKSTLIFFAEKTGFFFDIITNIPKNSDEYKMYKLIWNSQDYSIKNKLQEITDYKSFKTQKEFYRALKRILNIENPIDEEDKKKENNKDKQHLLTIEEISKNYVYTADNLIKMILILIRLGAEPSVPVIMMGETGCGKTSLIKKLSELKNNGSQENIKTINIHAGITDKEIIEKIKEFDEIAKKGKKLWIFLDEINTCKSMGLISELMCKRSYYGEKISDNIAFIAACNPYREIKSKNNDEIALNIKLAHKELEKINDKERKKLENYNNKTKLVYTVNPLPHSLLNFVFDFGSLKKEDEHKYIENMIEKPFNEIFYLNDYNIDNNVEKNEIKEVKNIEKEDEEEEEEEEDEDEDEDEEKKNEIKKEEINDNNKEEQFEKLKNIAIQMVSKAQNFIRDTTDASSVSLREIRKFLIFYKFFYEYLKFKKENYTELELQKETEFNYKNLSKYELQIYSINLSIYMCYYLRLTNKTLRDELVTKLNKIFKSISNNNNKKFPDFLYLPNIEKNYIANNISIPEGIAKNKSLLENLFSLFVCINNKIPLFIVGKPGCSKSLSVKLILKSMDFTENKFFKNYPNIMCQKYQGSLCSKSEEVIKVFEKAKKAYEKIKKEDLKKYISMIYFDEMGLAEHSKFNPLKTIHAELELDENDINKKISFVGISNWSLDASKMNRGIHISIPELDEDDIIKTALTIAESYDKRLIENDINKKFFENLGKTYYLYKKYLKEKINDDWQKEFHGLRDFYFFVKTAANKILSLTYQQNNLEKDIWLAGIESIERNFSGLIFEFNGKSSVDIVKEFYIKNMPEYIEKNDIIKNKLDIVKLIQTSVDDNKSRYLLIIAKPSISCHLLQKILKEKKYNIFIGSKFKNDFKNDDYHIKIINKIQACMDKGGTVVLKDFDYIYPALYDLLNQNFNVVTNRNFAIISVGTSNTYSYVNDNFKCIIIVDEDKINNQETPFLNRFEKFIARINVLLSNELILEAENIYNIFSDLFKKIENFNIIKYDLKKILINFNLEEIQGLIYQANEKENKISLDKIKEEVFNKFALTLPQDVMIFLKNIQFEYKDLLIKCYNKGEHRSLAKFLGAMTEQKNVVYTFSTDLDIIKNLKKIKNEKFDTIFNEENIKKIKIRGIKSEEHFEKEIDNFLKNDIYKICLIQFTSQIENNFMNSIKFFIENKEKEKGNNNKNKIFIFIVHMNRIFNDNNKKKENKNLNEDFSYLSGYYQIFIDNLNGDENINIEKIIESKNEDIIDYCFDLDYELKQNIYKAITYIKYNISLSLKDLNKDNYIEKLKSFIQKEENISIRKLINDCIKKKLIKDNVYRILYEKKDEIIQNKGNNNNDNKNISSDFIISKYDKDIIGAIKKYLFNIYITSFNYFLFLAENDNFFSSLLSLDIIYPDLLKEINKYGLIMKQKDKNEIIIEEKSEGSLKYKLISKIILNYFDNFSFERENIRFIEKQQRANHINILLGLSLPGYKKTIEDIISVIKENVINKYYINEFNMINLDEKTDEQTEKYNKELEWLNNLSKIEISKSNDVSRIQEEFKNDKNIIMEFYNLFINDYYVLFINNNLRNIIDVTETKKFFNEKIENKSIDEDCLKCAKKINYIECYKYQISLLLSLFNRN